MKYTNSPMEEVKLFNKRIFIKRDDLLSKEFSGNKARKLFYYLEHDFSKIKKVVSYGSAQSNSMYSISELCKIKSWSFEYYVSHIASYLKENPSGNYKAALENGMKIYEKELPIEFDNETLLINEGGANKEAQYGIKILANEINDFINENSLENTKVFLPSGTGTTSLYLQKYLSSEVITCACVGNKEYLLKQFEELETNNFPKVLENPKKYHFGKLYKEFYEIYKQVKYETNIEFDLLYDPLGLLHLKSYLDENPNTCIIYIHQGGILGNKTMIERYKYKFKEL